MGSGPEFFQTGMGRKFYEYDVPEIAKSLKDVSVGMAELVKALNSNSVNINEVQSANDVYVVTEHLDTNTANYCNIIGAYNNPEKAALAITERSKSNSPANQWIKSGVFVVVDTDESVPGYYSAVASQEKWCYELKVIRMPVL